MKIQTAGGRTLSRSEWNMEVRAVVDGWDIPAELQKDVIETLKENMECGNPRYSTPAAQALFSIWEKTERLRQETGKNVLDAVAMTRDMRKLSGDAEKGLHEFLSVLSPDKPIEVPHEQSSNVARVRRMSEPSRGSATGGEEDRESSKSEDGTRHDDGDLSGDRETEADG